jgi:hypothetical protein
VAVAGEGDAPGADDVVVAPEEVEEAVLEVGAPDAGVPDGAAAAPW